MPDARLFSLAGADSFRDLGRWREPERVLALAEWIVVSRPGFEFGEKPPEPSGMILSNAQRARIHPLRGVHEEVAATGLRQRLRAGDPCAGLLSPAVAAYIAQHGLYAAPRGSAAAYMPPP